MRFFPGSRVTTEMGQHILVTLNRVEPHWLKVREDVPRSDVKCANCRQWMADGVSHQCSSTQEA